MKILNFSLAIVLTVFLVGCGSPSNEEMVVGDWEMAKYDGSVPKTVSCIKFNEDKTARFYYLDQTITDLMDSFGNGEGTWSVEEDNLTVVQDNMNPITYKILKVTETELHIESSGVLGAVSEYKKRD